jgi:hypothetical protein
MQCLHIVWMPFTAYEQSANSTSNPPNTPPCLDWPYLCNQWSVRNGLKTRLNNRQFLTNWAKLYMMPTIYCSLTFGQICAWGPSLAHSRTKYKHLISTKAHISCTLPLGELLFQVWVCLPVDNPGQFYGRSKTGFWHNSRMGGVVCNTPIHRHCVGLAWGHRLYLAQSVQPESTRHGWRPASR